MTKPKRKETTWTMRDVEAALRNLYFTGFEEDDLKKELRRIATARSRKPKKRGMKE